MSTNLIKMEVKSIGKKIEYIKPEGVASNMCSVKAKDETGAEHEAYAWGSLCNELKVGNKVLATKWFSPKKEEDIDRFIIIKSLARRIRALSHNPVMNKK